jgi:hypothetical protein
MKYKLCLCQDGTGGLDNETNLRLYVERSQKPVYLADFANGTGELDNGYTGTTHSFTTAPAQNPTNLEISYSNSTNAAVLSPGFDNPPLQMGQYITTVAANTKKRNSYVITNFL